MGGFTRRGKAKQKGPEGPPEMMEFISFPQNVPASKLSTEYSVPVVASITVPS